MGHSEDDTVHKIPHENALAVAAENFGIGLNENRLRD